MKKYIDEVLYSISPDTVVARRYNPILEIGITAVAAVAMLGAGDVEPFASNRDMFQYLMMGGFLVLATGTNFMA